MFNICIYREREGGRGQCCVTCLSLVDEEGRMGRQNFFMEPMAAGKAGAENSAATRFIRKIQDIISSSLLKRRSRWRRGKRQDYFMTVFIVYGLCIKRLNVLPPVTPTHGACSRNTLQSDVFSFRTLALLL